MNKLESKAFGGLVNLVVCLTLMIFLPAWTFHYWQAWIFLCVFFACALGITVYLMRRDPELLKRRVKAGSAAEQETSQKIIQAFAAIAFVATVSLPALDHRFQWSTVSPMAVLAGNAFVVIGFFIVYRVFRENSFTSGTIEIGEGQQVVSTGPYAAVRHPMYAGALVLLVGIPVALASWWGLLALIPMTLVLAWRLVAEEKFLLKNLPGYAEYQNKVRYRLAPFIW